VARRDVQLERAQLLVAAQAEAIAADHPAVRRQRHRPAGARVLAHEELYGAAAVERRILHVPAGLLRGGLRAEPHGPDDRSLGVAPRRPEVELRRVAVARARRLDAAGNRPRQAIECSWIEQAALAARIRDVVELNQARGGPSGVVIRRQGREGAAIHAGSRADLAELAVDGAGRRRAGASIARRPRSCSATR
jgi:hypothetical protein